jgi:hypothetical protein
MDLNRRLERLEQDIGEALDAAGVPRGPAVPPVRIVGDPAEVETATAELSAALAELQALDPILVEEPRVDPNLPPTALTVEDIRRFTEAIKRDTERLE